VLALLLLNKPSLKRVNYSEKRAPASLKTMSPSQEISVIAGTAVGVISLLALALTLLICGYCNGKTCDREGMNNTITPFPPDFSQSN